MGPRILPRSPQRSRPVFPGGARCVAIIASSAETGVPGEVRLPDDSAPRAIDAFTGAYGPSPAERGIRVNVAALRRPWRSAPTVRARGIPGFRAAATLPG